MATVTAEHRSAPRWRKGVIGELWAEFFGTFILISFGDGVVAMLFALFGSGRTTPEGGLQSGGDWLLIGWGRWPSPSRFTRWAGSPVRTSTRR